MSALDDLERRAVMYARASECDSLWQSEIDRQALEFSKKVTARQPRADETINQLAQISSLSSSDLIPLWRNGQTYAVAASAIATFAASTAANGLGVINPLTYGAIGNGIADDTTAIQNALNAAAGGVLFCGGGTYNFKISSALTVNSRTKILGSGYGTTTFTQSNPALDIFFVPAASQYIEWEGCDFTYSSQATSGNVFNLLSGTSAATLNYIYIKQCAWTKCYNGVSCNGILALWVDKCVSSIGTPGNAASNFNIGTQVNPSTNLIYQSSQIAITSNSFGGTNSGQGLSLGSVNGIVSSNNNYFGFGYGFYCVPVYSVSSSSIGTPYVYNCTFSNDSWDKSGGYSAYWLPGNGGVIESMAFSNCWTGGAGNTGWYMATSGTGTITGIQVTTHRFYNSTTYGLYVAASTTISDLTFSNIFVAGQPGVGNGASTGVVVNGGSQVKILGGNIGAQSGYQGCAYGINLSTSTATNLKITDVDVSQNAIGISNPGGTVWVIRNCEGYNGTLGYLGAGTTPTTQTPTRNLSGVDQNIVISGGTVTYIAHGTQANCTGAVPPGNTGFTSGSIPWKAGEYYSLVYSVAPTLRFYEA